MMTKAQTREFINDLFEEEALAIGGLVALRKVDDETVLHLIRSIDAVRTKALERLDAADADGGLEGAGGAFDLQPHPVIENFLHKVRGGSR